MREHHGGVQRADGLALRVRGAGEKYRLGWRSGPREHQRRAQRSVRFANYRVLAHRTRQLTTAGYSRRVIVSVALSYRTSFMTRKGRHRRQVRQAEILLDLLGSLERLVLILDQKRQTNSERESERDRLQDC